MWVAGRGRSCDGAGQPGRHTGAATEIGSQLPWGVGSQHAEGRHVVTWGSRGGEGVTGWGGRTGGGGPGGRVAIAGGGVASGGGWRSPQWGFMVWGHTGGFRREIPGLGGLDLRAPGGGSRPIPKGRSRVNWTDSGGWNPDAKIRPGGGRGRNFNLVSHF
ncbi:hypothetical protein NL676_007116 [Syzygium grande]|nr:hypothetical protein NL676_007116 [Syzygium grande]